MANCGVNIKGSGFTNTYNYIQAKLGAPTLEKLLQALSPETRKITERVLPSTWLPVEHVGDLLRAMRQTLGGGDDTITTISRESAKATFSTLYKVFFKLGTPAFIIGRVASVWGTLSSAGTLAVADKGDKHLMVRLSNFPYRNPDYCGLRLMGWFMAPLELSGCQLTEAKHTQCTSRGSECCEWKFGWK